MPCKTKIHCCFTSVKVILIIWTVLLFLFVGRFISQKRKDSSIKFFGNYEVLTIVNLNVLTNLELDY